MPINQVGTVTSDLGPVGAAGEGFSLCRLETTEDLGRPFRFEATLLADDDIGDNIQSLLGTEMCCAIDLDLGEAPELRYFHGRVSRLVFNGTHGNKVRYQAILRPWIWFLKHSSNNRVFQDKTVPEIIKEVFGDHGESATDDLRGSYDTREYCVQYGETDFDFVSRLMEEEGIFYYFRHEESTHELVLADADSAHQNFESFETIRYLPPETQTSKLTNFISRIEDSYQVDTNAVALQSYNYEKPSTDLEARTVNSIDGDKSKGELYEYGSLYNDGQKGNAASKVRLEQQKARYRLLSASGPVKGVCAGYLIKLADAPLKSLNEEYLVISTRVEFQNNELDSGLGGDGVHFSCFFRAIPSKSAFRSPSYTPKAVVRGPQTAVVVGPKGDEIFTDSLGRVKIQFHWDRQGKADEKSSCMVRVSTAIAGSSWGMVSIPRIGQEVIVDFLEGDPDQPIIVGSVYNDTNKPPYTLPDHMTQSGFKTRTTDGREGSGDGTTFNEIRFEDKLDEEEVFIQAEKNFKRIVKNNDELQVGVEKGDPGDQTIEIQNDRTVTLHEGKDTLIVENNDQFVDVAKKIEITAGEEFVLTVGQSKLTLTSSGDVMVEGMNILVDGQVGVDVKGVTVKIDGSGEVGIKGGGQTKVEGSGMLDLKGGGMAKLKGGVTMIG